MRRFPARLLTGIALLLTLLAAPAQAAEWSPGGTLPSTYSPLAMTVDGGGGADLLLYTNAGTYTSRRPAGGAWSTPALLIADNVTSGRMVGNAAGDAVAVWDLNLGPNVYQTWIARRPAGGVWGAATLLAADNVAPDVAIDETGTVYVAAIKWSAPRSTVAYVLPPGSTTGTPTTLGPASAEIGGSRIAAANGRATIAWVEASTGTITAHLGSYEGGWSSVVSPVPGLQNMDVAIDRNGNAVVVGAGFASGASATWAFSRSPGGSWTTTELVHASSQPDVAIDAAGTATAVYRPFMVNTTNPAVARRRPLGGEWGPPQTLTGSGRVGAGGATTVYAQTTDASPTRAEAFVATGPGDLPTPPAVVSTTSVRPELPLVAVSSAGNAGMVWKREDSTVETAFLGAASVRVTGRVVRGIDGVLTAGNPDVIGVPGRTITFKGADAATAGQTFTATSGPDGTYEASVPAGGYLVELADGDCIAGVKGCATSVPFTATGATTVDVIHVSVRLTGKVRKRTCTANACKLAPLPDAAVAATAEGLQREATTTAKDGTWKLFIDPDVAYAVTATSGSDEVRPASRAVRSTVHVSDLDFATCVADAKAPKNACTRPDLVVEGIEVTQGIQEPVLPKPAKGPVAYTGVPLVAGRTTLVRVYLSNANPFAAPPSGVVAEVTVSQAGRKVARARATARTLPATPVLPGARLNRTNGVVEVVVPAWAIAGGSLVVRAELDPGDDIDQCEDCDGNDEAAVSVPLRRTTAPRVVILGLTSAGANGKGTVAVSGAGAAGPDAARKKLFEYAQRWLPIPNGTFAVETDVVAPLDISRVIRKSGEETGNWEKCVAFDPCAGRLINRLLDAIDVYALHQPAALAGAHVVAPTRNALVGTDDQGTHREIGGITSSVSPVSWTYEDAPATAFHELLHQFGLLHADTACGGEAGGQLHDPAWPVGRGFIDGFGVDLGPDLADVVKLVGPPRAFYDPMSYCRERANYSNTWISTRNWTQMVTKLGGGPTTLPTPTLAATKGALYVSAFVTASGAVTLTTTAPVDATLTPADPAGAYVVVVRDAAGAERSRTTVGATGGNDGSLPRIVAVVPAGSAAAAVDILPVAGGAPLATAAAASTPLAVKLAAPAKNARVPAGKALTVRWTATGAAADAVVTGVVELSVDGGKRWRVLGQSDAGTLSVPARLLARATAARVRVRLDDGFRTATAEVRGLRLAGRAPTVRLVLPFRQGATIAAGSRGALSATATDDAGRAVTGGKLVWRRGTVVLARGARLSLSALKAGRYTVTVAATDRYGRVGKATVAFRVR